MSRQKGPDTKKRYRAYFLLMNVSLVAVIIGFLDLVIKSSLGYSVSNAPEPFNYIIALPLWLFGLIVPLFLMVAKFMRDEYAEQLWRRTLVVLAYILGLTPITIYAAAWFAFLFLGQNEPGIFSFLQQQHQFAAILQFFWMWFMVLFVGIFQFLRWKDSQ